jgi:2-oxoisovalerate dehydrogenase E1 component
MGRFRSAEELYTLLDALFHRLRAIPEIRQALTASPMIVRFRFHDPTGEVTIDLRQDPPQWTFGPSDLPADVEMIQSADTAHRFWMGQLNVPQAIATRQIIARGNIPKALRLLPALRPAFQVYPQMLRELGMTHLLEEPSPTPRRRFPRLRLSLPWRARPEVALPPPQLWPIPLVDAEAVEPMPPPPRPHPLPEDPIALRREMLRRMLLIRAFEETLAAEFARGAIPAETIHLSTGQEAVAVGVAFALRPTDWMTTTHRGHGHMLAKGADLDGMMAEIFGKAEGLCKGKGGSMHVTDARIGALGANGIVGASLVIGAGAALAAKLRGEDRVVVAFCGDGATNQGMFHEALNFAAVFQLPLIVVIENNGSHPLRYW